MLKRLLFVCGALFFANMGFAQTNQRSCAAQDVHEQKMATDAQYRANRAAIEAQYDKYLKQGANAAEAGVRTIPVYVHVIYNNSQQNISNAQIQSQIDVLNEDFRATNSDLNQTPSEFAGSIADYGIEFELVQVTRKSSTRSSWGTNDAMKKSSQGGVNPITPNTHLNMWVCEIGGGILGYAQFPGGSASTDGVVMSPQYFGSSDYGSFYLSAPFDKGRTATHEVGHYLNLRHIWGDGGCSVDDYVSDTPTAGGSNYGCPSYPSKSCSSNGGYSSDMFMNYMDYVDDRCMFMFTSGQKTRTASIFAPGGSRQNLGTVDGGGGGGGLTCSSAVSSFPYSEGFESGLGNWSQASGDNFDWTRRSGGTPSSNTGPSGAYAGSNYMFVESSSPNYSNKVAILNGPCFDLAGENSATFTFRYHMYGTSAMGGLELQASTDNSWTTVWSKSGNQGNSWKEAAVDLGAYTGAEVKLRYVGTTGTTWQGDMAIDALSLNSSGGGGGGGTTTVNLSIKLDNYPEETSWQIRSGSTVLASGGTYGSQADGSTVTQSIELADGCYDFVINDAYGDGICCSYGNGNYSLTANGSTLASGGSFASSETTNFCVGAGARGTMSVKSEGTAPTGFEVFPNPASQHINIYSGKMDSPTYTIINAAGHVWKEGKLSGNQSKVDVTSLKAGFYFVRVTDGENVIVHKVVKQ